MHELALIQELCALAQAAAEQHGATRITQLWLRLGDRCGVDADALRQAFEVVQAQHCWRQTHLNLELVPTQCRCLRCHQLYRPEDVVALCPQCGGLACDRLTGQELTLVAVEVA